MCAASAQGVIVLCNIASNGRLPIVAREAAKLGASIMPITFFKFSLRLFAVVAPLGLSACADTLRSDETTSNATLQRDYERTLSKSEQEAVISDMQSATAKAKSENAAE